MLMVSLFTLDRDLSTVALQKVVKLRPLRSIIFLSALTIETFAVNFLSLVLRIAAPEDFALRVRHATATPDGQAAPVLRKPTSTTTELYPPISKVGLFVDLSITGGQSFVSEPSRLY